MDAPDTPAQVTSALLERFIAIVEAGSLNKAALRLGMSQPAMTRSLQVLEQAYGAELLQRGTSGVVLTAFGEVVLRRAKLIQAELRHIANDVNALRNLSIGRVHVGVPIGIGFTSVVLPSVSLRLLTESARLEISYSIGAGRDLIASLRRGDLDFVISDIDDGQYEDDLIQEELFFDRGAVVVRRDHPLARQRSFELGDLTAFPWTVLAESAPLESTLRVALAKAKQPFERSVLRSNSALFVKSTISRGDVIGLVSLDAVRVELDGGGLVEITARAPALNALIPSRALGLIRRREGLPSTAANVLIKELQRECRELRH